MTPCWFCLQVLATDRNPDIEYEYWLPPDQYALHHGRKSPLRQAQHTANYLPWDQPVSTAPPSTTQPPPITTRPHWGKRWGWGWILYVAASVNASAFL